jgi:hypothetical protein
MMVMIHAGLRVAWRSEACRLTIRIGRSTIPAASVAALANRLAGRRLTVQRPGHLSSPGWRMSRAATSKDRGLGGSVPGGG